jgi:hypothetical protein
MSDGHVLGELPAYVGGALSPGELDKVRWHLASCDGCRRELAEWEALAGAASALVGHAAPPRIPAGVWAAIDGERDVVVGARRDWRRALSLSWQLLWAQVSLVRRSIWAASALTMAMGLLVALLTASPGSRGAVLAVFAPIVAAVGVALVSGPEEDVGLELALATPTSPRLVLLSRLTLVYAYDLALALLASIFLSLTTGGMAGTAVWPLVELWLGPMLFLSALALLLSLLFGTTTAVLAATALWGARLTAATQPMGGMELLDAFWQTNLALVPLAALLFAVAVAYAPRRADRGRWGTARWS